METLNYTEEQSTELFELMADLHEAKKLEEQALVESFYAQSRHRELQVKAVKLQCEIDRIKEGIILKDFPYKVGQKFLVDDETYDQIKIEYLSAYGGDIDIRFKGRKRATKGWEGKSRDTTVELLNAFIVSKL